MSGYRVYLFGQDGHIAKGEIIECTNDEEAIQKAKQFVHGCDVELWQLSRFIASFPKTNQKDR